MRLKKLNLEYIEATNKLKILKIGTIDIFFTDIEEDGDNYNLYSNKEHIADIPKEYCNIKLVKP